MSAKLGLTQFPGLARCAVAVGVATLGARLVGLVKEGALAGAFGASAEMDALSLALLVPSSLGALLAGALPLALVPAFAAERGRAGGAAADALYRSVSTMAVAALLALSAGVALAAGPCARAVALDAAPATVERTAGLLRALAFALGATGLATVLRTRLFVADRFLAGSLAPVAVSAVTLAAVATGAARTAEGVAAAVLAGHALEIVLLALALRAARIPSPIGRPERGTGAAALAFFAGALPVVVGAGVVSLNGLVDQTVASRLAEGSVASLRFADQVLQIPIALLAMAVSTAVFPRFSRQAAAGDADGLRETFALATRSVLLVALPAAAALVAVPDVVIAILFERGAFDAAATAAAAAPLRILGLALPFLAYGYVNGRAYNALRANGVLVKVAFATLGANLLLDLALVGPFGTAGIAAATVLAQGGAAVALFVFLERRLGAPLLDAATARSLGKGVLTSVALGAVLAAVRSGVAPARPVATVLVAIPAALALAFFFHRADLSALVASLRRRS